MPKHLNSRNIFFIRHGQSESNVNESMAAGMNYDAPLTDLGKKQAEALGERFKRDGIYFKQTKKIEGVEIDIIGLDTRYFRSKLKGKKNAYQPNNDSSATILGQDQWAWLKSSIFNSNAEIIVILSSIQILATNQPYEKWDNFPQERKKLLNLMAIAAKDKTIIAVTGDRHRSGIYQNQDFVEITASSLNRPASRGKETDPLLIGNTYREKNYGVLNFELSKNKITLSIHNKSGQKLNSKIINIHQER